MQTVWRWEDVSLIWGEICVGWDRSECYKSPESLPIYKQNKVRSLLGWNGIKGFITIISLSRLKNKRLSLLAGLLLPWLLSFSIPLLAATEVSEDTFGKFGYDPLRGQCSVTSMRVYNVMEILGTYLPFTVMVLAYTRINTAVTSFSPPTLQANPYIRYFKIDKRTRSNEIFIYE